MSGKFRTVLAVWLAALALVAGAAIAQETPKNLPMLDTGGHLAIIQDIAFTPDGRQLVSASDDKTIRVWDLATGRTVRTIRGESAPGDPGKIYAMALSPDGKWLATAGTMNDYVPAQGPWRTEEWVWYDEPEFSYPIRLFNFANGRLVGLLKGHKGFVTDLAFSPDSRLLISGSADKTAFLWDVGARRLLQQLASHHKQISAVGFSPDGARVITGSVDQDLRLWQVADGFEIAQMTGHNDAVSSVAVAQDGTIASGDKSGEIRLWDGRSGAFRKVLVRHGTGIGSLSFGPEARILLASCGAGGCTANPQAIFDVDSGQEITTYGGHDNVVGATAISPDGRWAATGGGTDHSIHIWDLKTGKHRPGADGKPLILGGKGKMVWAVGFSADGEQIGWGNIDPCPTEIRCPNVGGHLQYTLTLPSVARALSKPVSPTEERIGVFRRAITKQNGWSLIARKDWSVEIEHDGRTVTSLPSSHSAYSFTPGRKIISSSGNGNLKIYDRTGSYLGRFVGHEGTVTDVAPSPDGQYLISGAADQSVRLWNLTTRELLVTLFHGADGEWVMWTPEGFFIASENGGNLVGWQINQGPDKEARYVAAEQVRKLFYRPDLVAAKIEGGAENVHLLREEAERLDIDAILTSGPAPEVAILTPDDGWEANEKTVRINFNVRDMDGGIGRIELRINNALLGTHYGIAGEQSFDVELAEPENRIEIAAYNRDNFILSPPARLTVKVRPKVLKGIPDLYVLAIGVNSYRDSRRRLDYAVSDARMLGETLASAGRDYYRNAPEVITLADEEVTTERLTEVFETLGRKVKARDVFVFFIAGHGKNIRGDYYFAPPHLSSFDQRALLTEGFGPDQWREWFARIKAQKSVFIFDTCESGAVRSSVFNVNSPRPKYRGGNYNTAHRRLIDATGRTVLMAASDEQLAVEGYRGHGVFTYALLEAFGKADHNANSLIEMMELIEHVDRRVPEISRELKTCVASGPDDFCQKPEVDLERRPFYTLVPLYKQVLTQIETEESTVAAIPVAATHVVLKKVTVILPAGRGDAGRVLNPGDVVRVMKKEVNRLLIAQDGVQLGYLPNEVGVLLKLNVQSNSRDQ